MQRWINKLQTISVVMNLILIAATMIALPVGKHLASERNSAKYIFTQTENFTTWPTGWAFMLAWMSPIWTIGDFDSCVHMSEEGQLVPTPVRFRLADFLQH
jgi:amino acid transporter